MQDLTKHIMVHQEQMKAFSDKPFIIADAKGIRVRDINGKEYIDGLAGVFVSNIGHGNSAVLEAVTEQLYKITFAPPIGSINVPALKLAEAVLKVAPKGFTVVKFTSAGSQATEMAMKMARQYQYQAGNPRKYKIVSRYLAFHGATWGAMSASGLAGIKTMYEPGVDGFVHVPPPYCYRCPLGHESADTCGIACARLLEQTILWEGPETVGAVIVDPIMVSAGVLTPPREYFTILRETCDKHGVLLIFDEMIVGFGRLGKWWAADYYGVTPDLMALGKGMGGGYATIAGVLVSEKVAQAFWGDPDAHVQFQQAHTYDNNALSAAAALANLQQMIALNAVENAAKMGAYMADKFKTLYDYPIVGDVRGAGLLWAAELVKDRKTKEPFSASVKPGRKVGDLGRERGLIMRYEDNWIGLGPALTVTREEVDEMFEIMRSAVEDLSRELVG
jgi:taurine-pyruvate aminotransferase